MYLFSAYKMWMILKKSPTVSNTKLIHLTIIFNILLSLFLPVYLMSTALTGTYSLLFSDTYFRLAGFRAFIF